jgi:C1A family cysteine protease
VSEQLGIALGWITDVKRVVEYGWVHDLADARDFVYAAPLTRFPQGLPASVDLRTECPPVYDQGQLGSCTAKGIAGAIDFDQHKQGTKEFTPSRLFIYYNERVIEGTVKQDSGAQVRDGIKSVGEILVRAFQVSCVRSISSGANASF